VLRAALARYDELASPRMLTFGANAEVQLTGADLHTGYHEGVYHRVEGAP
jgi:hypothetical protein